MTVLVTKNKTCPCAANYLETYKVRKQCRDCVELCDFPFLTEHELFMSAQEKVFCYKFSR